MMSANHLDLALYAVQSFSFLLPQHEPFTFSMLAQAIRRTYDTGERRTQAVLAVLDTCPDCFGKLL